MLSKLTLMSGRKINFQNSFIHQPSINDIDIVGEEKYNELLLPFVVNLDNLNLPDNVKKDLKIFDMFFIDGFISPDGKLFKDILVESLIFFLKGEIMVYDKEWKIIVDYATEINRHNFDELGEIIRRICCIDNNKNEHKQEIKFKSQEAKEKYEKLMKYRQRSKSKEDDNFANMVSFVVNVNRNADRQKYDSVMQMTVFQFINSYQSFLSLESYDYNKLLTTSGMVEVKDIDKIFKQWVESTKIKIE